MNALRCYRCGHSLADLTLPLRRLEECPACRAQLHVCRMCVRFAPRLPTGCSEQDAPEVRDKGSANFCDYFAPSTEAFDARFGATEARARAELDALFGKSSPTADGTAAAAAAAEPADKGLTSAHSLFKK